MKTSKDSSADTFDRTHFSREPVPNSQMLQASIIDNAKRMTQQAPSKDQSLPIANPARFFAWYRPALYSTALAAMLLITIVSLSPFDFSDPDTPLDTYSENDLDWQELMLIEDEFLFAQL